MIERIRHWPTTLLLTLLSEAADDTKDPVLPRALRPSDEETIEQAIDALATSNEPSAGPALVRLLNSPSELVRLASIEALERIEDPSSLIQVIMCMGDPCRPVRLAAASAIASSPAGNVLLEHLAKSSDPTVEEAAFVGLYYLSRENGHLNSKSLNERNQVDTSNGHHDLKMPEWHSKLAAQSSLPFFT